MDNQEYEARAALTAPDSAVMHLNMVPPKALYGILMNLRQFEPGINACKKLLVYGPKAPDGIADTLSIYDERDDSPFNPGKNFNAKVAHGIIGVVSETLELGDNLLTSLFGGDELDTGNIKEEVGDILWYLARLAKASGFTLSEAMASNIAKLEVRHLNKTGGFNPDAATEDGRDRDAEQAAARNAEDGSKPMERRLWELDQQVATASDPGSYDANPYLHGMANGLILAAATLKNEEPVFLTWPEGKEAPQQTNYRGDDLGEKQPAAETTQHVHAVAD